MKKEIYENPKVEIVDLGTAESTSKCNITKYF